MITPEYCRLMARYNDWQNDSLIAAADTLDPERRAEDGGAFFGSIVRTLNHIYWGDRLWLERLEGEERPSASLAPSMDEPSDWTVYKIRRKDVDAELMAWAAGLDQTALEGRVGWYPLNGSIRIEKPRDVCVASLFNHQTHHRGQAHCLLTAAGAAPDATDLLLLG